MDHSHSVICIVYDIVYAAMLHSWVGHKTDIIYHIMWSNVLSQCFVLTSTRLALVEDGI